MEFIGGHHGGSHCCQRKTLLHVWSLQKSTWTFHSTTGKIFCGQMNPKFSWNTTLCVEKKRHSTPTSKPHPNCEIWGRGHHGLGLLRCLRAWTDCCHRWKNEFPIVSKHFAGKLKTICPPTQLFDSWPLLQSIYRPYVCKVTRQSMMRNWDSKSAPLFRAKESERGWVRPMQRNFYNATKY